MILHERYYSPVVSTIKISSMKHIRPAKLKKIAKNLYFGSLDHSKIRFEKFEVAKCWKTLSSITICNTKSIYQTKLQKMAKNLYFGSLDHSKMRFCDFRMTLYDKAMLPNVEKHLVLSQYATSSRSNRPKSRNWSKTSFLGFWIIQKCIFDIFE